MLLTLVWEDRCEFLQKNLVVSESFPNFATKRAMIKKTKDAYKQIAEKVTEALEYNKTHTTQYSRINLTTLNISRGLYNTIIKNGIVVAVYNVCQELGISAEEPPFEITVHDNDDYCQMFIRF